MYMRSVLIGLCMVAGSLAVTAGEPKSSAGPARMGGIAIDAKTNAYVHVIFIVNDAKAVCQRLAEAKMPCDREPVSQGPSNTIAAFARDPDGHAVEFLQLTK